MTDDTKNLRKAIVAFCLERQITPIDAFSQLAAMCSIMLDGLHHAVGTGLHGIKHEQVQHLGMRAATVIISAATRIPRSEIVVDFRQDQGPSMN